jgi:hypothetical protein
MEIQDFWNTYSGGLAPAELVWRFGKGDPVAGVKAYIQARPAMYGILCKGTWKETFSVHEQFNRERVAAALLTHLEMTRDEWENQVQGYATAEAEARLAARRREEAEALAAAVARVEAEARAKAAAESGQELPQEAPPPEQPILSEPGAGFIPPPVDHGLTQARTSSDAEAIAAAMARVEAEARAKAAAEEKEKERADEAMPTEESVSSAPESVQITSRNICDANMIDDDQPAIQTAPDGMSDL